MLIPNHSKEATMVVVAIEGEEVALTGEEEGEVVAVSINNETPINRDNDRIKVQEGIHRISHASLVINSATTRRIVLISYLIRKKPLRIRSMIRRKPMS